MSEKIVADAKVIAALCVELADDCKAENIVCLDVAAVTFMADYFVICTGHSTTQIAAIQSRLERGVREKLKTRPLSVEGDGASGWVLVDFGSVLVHIMTAEVRERYQLEKLWGDAPTAETRRALEALRPEK